MLRCATDSSDLAEARCDSGWLSTALARTSVHIGSMKAKKLLRTRASVDHLRAPAPDDETLDDVFRSALRAPDHGGLEPFRIFAFRGEGLAKLGALMGEARAREKGREVDVRDVEKATRKIADRAPLVLAVAATIRPSKKVPEIEQILSAGCVMYGLHLALAAEGFGSVWKTDACYDEHVKERLGLAPSDHLIGLLYVGTPDRAPTDRARPDPKGFVTYWNG